MPKRKPSHGRKVRIADLTSRVAARLRETPNIDAEDLSTELRSTFPAYQRHAFPIFQRAVEQEMINLSRSAPLPQPQGEDSGAEFVESGAEFSDSGQGPKKRKIDTSPLSPTPAPPPTPSSSSSTPAPSSTPVPSTPAKRRRREREMGGGIGGMGGGERSYQAEIPKARYTDLGGVDSCLQEIRELLEYPLLHPELYNWLGILPSCGVLLHGPPGCGKTLLASAIAGELQLPFFRLAATEVVSGMSGESEENIRNLFDSAKKAAPSIIFIDEIDAVTPKRSNAQREMERRIVAQLLSSLDTLRELPSDKMVVVLGATSRPDALDAGLRRAGRFDREISMGIPNLQAREDILKVLTNKLKLSGEIDLKQLALATPGYVGADLAALTKEAAVFAVNRIVGSIVEKDMERGSDENVEVKQEKREEEEGEMEVDEGAQDEAKMEKEEKEEKPEGEASATEAMEENEKPAEKQEISLQQRELSINALRKKATPLTPDQMEGLAIEMPDFQQALKKVQPSAKREGFATIPNVSWEDIGALANVRKELERKILTPIRRPERFQAFGLETSAGLLLFGPPGCGKTLLAKAIANEANTNFISVKGPELLNKYVGESERAVRQVFQRAASSSPCVIFFDELDALCPRRTGDSGSQATERVVNQLLTEMDGLEGRRGVFIIGATNRPDIIDRAMLRPGRLDKCIFVPLPTKDDRAQILGTLLRKTPVAPNVNLEEIAGHPNCNRLSGADLAALVREAAVIALMEQEDEEKPSILTEHLLEALQRVKPSVSAADETTYDVFSKEFS